MDVSPLLQDFSRVRRVYDLIRISVPHRQSRPWTCVPICRRVQLSAPFVRRPRRTMQHAPERLLQVARGAIRQSGDDCTGGKKLWITSQHNRSHRATRREPSDKDPFWSHSQLIGHFLDHLRDRGRFSPTTPGVSRQKPVERSVRVVRSLLLRQKQTKSASVCEGHPPCSIRVTGSGLARAVQNDHQSRICKPPRWHVFKHVQIAGVVSEIPNTPNSGCDLECSGDTFASDFRKTSNRPPGS